MQLQPGAHVVARSVYDDRITWVLPPDRLAAFRRAGAVIEEDKRTTALAKTTVGASPHAFVTLQGTLYTTTIDVPRHSENHSVRSIDATITPRNESVPARMLDVEEAPMADLPAEGVCVGKRWSTRVPVITALGSGVATIDHTVLSSDAHSVLIGVSGSGVINGAEYNLPRLLPGAIGIAGRARYDLATRTVTSESYVLHNRLIRTVHGKTIGFLETENVDVRTTVGTPSASVRAPVSPATAGQRKARPSRIAPDQRTHR